MRPSLSFDVAALQRARAKPSRTKALASYFGKGLLVFLPIVGTSVAIVATLRWLDSMISLPIPGLGILILLSAILITGFLASNMFGAAILHWTEEGIRKLPVASLLYFSIKDLLGAFVGEKKSFDRPVMVRLDKDGDVRVFGFVTCASFDDARLKGRVAVYLPQAYNFAGNVVIVPEAHVESVDADPAQFMAFVVSGGVSEMRGASTMMDDGTFIAKVRAAQDKK